MLMGLMLLNVQDLCCSFEPTSPTQHTTLQANSVLIVSGFTPKLVSGSETGAHSGVHKGVETVSHTHAILFITRPPCSTSFPSSGTSALFCCYSLSLPTAFLCLPSDWLTEQPANPHQLPEESTSHIRESQLYNSRISNCYYMLWHNHRVLCF